MGDYRSPGVNTRPQTSERAVSRKPELAACKTLASVGAAAKTLPLLHAVRYIYHLHCQHQSLKGSMQPLILRVKRARERDATP